MFNSLFRLLGYAPVKTVTILVGDLESTRVILKEAKDTNFKLAVENAKLLKKTEPQFAILFCPNCKNQHIDKEEWATIEFAHQMHLCEHCGCPFTPLHINTVGVEKLPEEVDHG